MRGNRTIKAVWGRTVIGMLFLPVGMGCVGNQVGNGGGLSGWGVFGLGSKGGGREPAGKILTEEPPAKEPELVGTVRLIQGDFVLIEGVRSRGVAAVGAPLTAGSDRAVELRMSEERKGGFLVADLVKGRPQVGDRVMTVPESKEGERGMELR